MAEQSNDAAWDKARKFLTLVMRRVSKRVERLDAEAWLRKALLK